MSDQPGNYGTSAALTANAFTRTNYTFAHWTTAANGTGSVYTDGQSYDFTADLTLYAQWTGVAHSVPFDANGGSGAMRSEEHTSEIQSHRDLVCPLLPD